MKDSKDGKTGENKPKKASLTRADTMRGNKNGVRTGAAEHIFAHVMTDEENEIFASMSTDVLTQLDYDIKIITIRERRMLERIARLEESAFMIVKKEDSNGKQGNRKTEQKVIASEASLLIIQQIEEALTRVQEKKARLIEAKSRHEREQTVSDSVDVAQFVLALGASAESVWAQGEQGGGSQPNAPASDSDIEQLWADEGGKDNGKA